ncbi:hypothetical protein [Niameybacter massiliensis]|uniref:hypothetical protein n=1 Tax=Niameybacter massiliensis TaxID=1658108 RepID=UPI0006B4F4D8|nr:hypothetical protein [Niameybacter massiliensis]
MNEVIREEQRFLGAEDVAKTLGVSTVTGYRIIKKLNDELKAQGYIVVAGKISKRYFNEKVYM